MHSRTKKFVPTTSENSEKLQVFRLLLIQASCKTKFDAFNKGYFWLIFSSPHPLKERNPKEI